MHCLELFISKNLYNHLLPIKITFSLPPPPPELKISNNLYYALQNLRIRNLHYRLILINSFLALPSSIFKLLKKAFQIIILPIFYSIPYRSTNIFGNIQYMEHLYGKPLPCSFYINGMTNKVFITKINLLNFQS